ncbi:MAG: hypothetical protein Q9191_002017 [Dirinaria sp. TL-2023a]
MSVWNPDNIRDVAESVGIGTLGDEVLQTLCSDIEFRLSLVLEEALKFMRHRKSGTLSTQDVTQALRVLDVEPLYGYESTRPLKFGEASIGPGQPLYYVEDEEVDFEKFINAPLPKVPREIAFTAHWLAVEGVQPSIPQNPSTADARNQELVPKGPGANPHMSAINGDNVTVKPLVKHILSKELLLYFEKICGALVDESSDEYRLAAIASIRTDPGLHQLVPYFVQFIAEKVTHNLKNLFILTQMMHLAMAMLENDSLYVDPYIASVIPPILTCLIGKRLGPISNPANPVDPTSSYPLRSLAASILRSICKKYSKTSHTLKPRLARTCLKHFLDPTKPLGSNYGGIVGLAAIGGPEVVRALIVPNLSDYDRLILREAMEDESRRKEAEVITEALVEALGSLEADGVGMANGHANGDAELNQKLKEKVGDLVGTRLLDLDRPRLVKAILEA